MSRISRVYQPIEKDIERVEGVLQDKLKTSYHSLCQLNDYLLSWGGKRLRPALVMLSARAISPQKLSEKELNLLVLLGAAIELIHTASLIHDDIIDDSPLRRGKHTIHTRWGKDTAIAFGDYIYSKAFELVASCDRPDVLDCVAKATTAMCEGQLFQILERDNFDLQKEEYFVIVKKKTANLIAACCKGAALIIDRDADEKHSALDNYGLNFGIAFQIVDDYMDIMADESKFGKKSGQDIAMGEVTLPLYDLLDSLEDKDRKELKQILLNRNISADVLKKIKNKIIGEKIFLKTKEKALSYIRQSQRNLNVLKDSCYRNGLIRLADYVLERGFPSLSLSKKNP
ncbi:MAG: polyprenyl synthetase family protein [Candidatus Omnitrophota bacterium]|nr:polyprenyl synthetase family protein [Candidatus Omnitrophota bacterium]